MIRGMDRMTTTMSLTAMTAQERVRRRIVRLLAASRRRQVDFAVAIGMTQPDLSKRLNGKARWQIEELDGVAAFFDLTVAELFFDEFGRFDRRKGRDRRSNTDRRKVNRYRSDDPIKDWHPPSWIRTPPEDRTPLTDDDEE